LGQRPAVDRAIERILAKEEESMGKIRRVLHASDFSRASRAAFAKAVDMAKANRAELILVHVWTPPMPVVEDAYLSPKTWQDLEASARGAAQKDMAKLLAAAKKAGVRASGTLLEGIPHEQIVRAAKAKRADVVVVGTHGRTGLARMFLGSVAGRVVTAAPCPVLTVRGK
jgi:nucleotide-binding universal stress UspA family protein